MHRTTLRDGAACQQICAAPAQFPRGRAAEGEPPAACFHEPVDFVEQGWNLLNFIQYDPSALRLIANDGLDPIGVSA
jgi:hypothetical protein